MATTEPGKEEKIKNAICYFAFEHERFTGKLVTLTSLYNYLAFLDYASLEKTGHPALGLLYSMRGRHPLPVNTHARLQGLRMDPFTFLSQGKGGYLVKARQEPDLSWFSPFEKNQMKRLVETYAHRFAKAGDAAGATGLPKRRWKGAEESVGYEDVFNDDFVNKYKEAYTMAGLHTLMERYVAQIKELESRTTDTKHKLEVVMEALRLLTEEGLSDEVGEAAVGGGKGEKIW